MSNNGLALVNALPVTKATPAGTNPAKAVSSAAGAKPVNDQRKFIGCLKKSQVSQVNEKQSEPKDEMKTDLPLDNAELQENQKPSLPLEEPEAVDEVWSEDKTVPADQENLDMSGEILGMNLIAPVPLPAIVAAQEALAVNIGSEAETAGTADKTMAEPAAKAAPLITLVPEEGNSSFRRMSNTRTAQWPEKRELLSSNIKSNLNANTSTAANANNLVLAGVEHQDGTDVKQIMMMESSRWAAMQSSPNNQAGSTGMADSKTITPGLAEPEIEETDPKLTDLNAALSGRSTEADKSINLLPGKETTAKAAPQPQEILDQIVKKAELMVKAGVSEMKIELKPEFLGRMFIKIALEDGILTARFTAENQQVKNMLEANLANLRQSLEAQGIKVEKTEVNVQLGSNNFFDGSEQQRQNELWQRFQEQPSGNNNYLASKEEYEEMGALIEDGENAADYYDHYSPDSAGLMDLMI